MDTKGAELQNLRRGRASQPVPTQEVPLATFSTKGIALVIGGAGLWNGIELVPRSNRVNAPSRAVIAGSNGSKFSIGSHCRYPASRGRHQW